MKCDMEENYSGQSTIISNSLALPHKNPEKSINGINRNRKSTPKGL